MGSLICGVVGVLGRNLLKKILKISAKWKNNGRHWEENVV